MLERRNRQGLPEQKEQVENYKQTPPVGGVSFGKYTTGILPFSENYVIVFP